MRSFDPPAPFCTLKKQGCPNAYTDKLFHVPPARIVHMYSQMSEPQRAPEGVQPASEDYSVARQKRRDSMIAIFGIDCLNPKASDTERLGEVDGTDRKRNSFTNFTRGIGSCAGLFGRTETPEFTFAHDPSESGHRRDWAKINGDCRRIVTKRLLMAEKAVNIEALHGVCQNITTQYQPVIPKDWNPCAEKVYEKTVDRVMAILRHRLIPSQAESSAKP